MVREFPPIGSMPISEFTLAQMVRLADILLQQSSGNISCGKARETLREEGFPPEVWRKVFVVTDDPDFPDARAKVLETLWIERERSQRGLLDVTGTVHDIGTPVSEATKACRRELQEAFGLVTPAS